MSDLPQKPEDLPTFAEGSTAADAPTFSPDALTVSDTVVTFAPGMAVTAAAVPATIGRYRIVRLIGEGGMGAVYEAEQDQRFAEAEHRQGGQSQRRQSHEPRAGRRSPSPALSRLGKCCAPRRVGEEAEELIATKVTKD